MKNSEVSELKNSESKPLIQKILLSSFFTLFVLAALILLFPGYLTDILNPNATGWNGLGTGLFLIYAILPAILILMFLMAISMVIIKIKERRK